MAKTYVLANDHCYGVSFLVRILLILFHQLLSMYSFQFGIARPVLVISLYSALGSLCALSSSLLYRSKFYLIYTFLTVVFH